ncbi:MAG: hypothetical protein HDT16_07805 [Oscillibacter sp.]|nr:hypothetical protein [Oscillibacter sp.]
MKREENVRSRRRVPAVVLVAAILAIALAGTALAAELLGHIRIDLKNPDETNTSGEGYTGEATFYTIPAESLSAAALERAAEMEDISDNWKFDSWSEAAAFLGLELMNNPKLENLSPAKKRGSCNAFVLNYGGDDRQHNVPFLIMLSAAYQADGCRIIQGANLNFQYPGYAQIETGWGLAKHSGETHLEEYTTSGGIEVSIVTTTRNRQAGATSSIDYTSYTAYWVTDCVMYSLHTSVHDPMDHPDSTHALAILKEVLDAYE